MLSVLLAAIAGGTLVAIVQGLPTEGSHHRAGITVHRSAPGAPSSRPGRAIFSGNWETGDTSQWSWGAQCANTGVVGGYAVRGTVNIVEDLVAQGKYAARFDLPAAARPSACEVLRKRTEALGSDDWYALEVYFPSDWQEPSSAFWGLLLAQFDFQGVVGTPVGLYAHADHVNVGIESGLCTTTPPASCQYTTGNDAAPGNQGSLGYTLRIVPLGTRLAGTWQQFIVHVHHAANSSGLVQGWWRPRGGTWAETVNWSGYPTVQWSATKAPETEQVTADKIGAYRGTSSFPISIWQDGFCAATSFSAAESCL